MPKLFFSHLGVDLYWHTEQERERERNLWMLIHFVKETQCKKWGRSITSCSLIPDPHFPDPHLWKGRKSLNNWIAPTPFFLFLFAPIKSESDTYFCRGTLTWKTRRKKRILVLVHPDHIDINWRNLKNKTVVMVNFVFFPSHLNGSRVFN